MARERRCHDREGKEGREQTNRGDPAAPEAFPECRVQARGNAPLVPLSYRERQGASDRSNRHAPRCGIEGLLERSVRANTDHPNGSTLPRERQWPLPHGPLGYRGGFRARRRRRDLFRAAASPYAEIYGAAAPRQSEPVARDGDGGAG